MGGDQLGLLLWKNYVVRKRQPGIMSLVFLWPIFVFMILYTVRDNIDPEYFPTCQFQARFMPQDGILPFVQSFVCGVGNPCEPLSESEEVPSYKNAMLSPLITELQTVLRNDTILSAISYLPKGVQLFTSMAQILTKPEIKKLFDRGIFLGDLFNNHEAIKRSLKTQMPQATDYLLDGLFNSSIKLIYLIEGLGSTNIEDTVCVPDNLKKFLIVPKEMDLVTISKVLCEIDPAKIPGIFEQLTKHLDFTSLLEMVSRVMAKFQDYDFIKDIKKTIETVLNLGIIDKYVPNYLRLRDWVPKIIPLFKNTTFKEIDIFFINKTITMLDPIFKKESDWKTARSAFLKLNDLLVLVKNIVGKMDASNETISSMMKNIGGNLEDAVSIYYHQYEANVTKVLDISYLILVDGIKLTKKLIVKHEDQLQLAAEILDGLKNFFSKKILYNLSYLVSMFDNVVQMTHHVAIIHEELLIKLKNIVVNHQPLVEKILTTQEPDVYRTIINSFSRLDFVEKFLEELSSKTAEDIFCDDTFFRELFFDLENKDRLSKLNNTVCNEEGKKFLSDVYNAMELQTFSRIVDNTLNTFKLMALRKPMVFEKSNLTAMVGSVRSFITYLQDPESRRLETVNLSSISIPNEWKTVFEETQLQARLDILSLHLSEAKELGSKSLTIITVLPNLIKMDLIASSVLRDLETHPTEWIADVRLHKSELIESFYLTVADRPKVLKLLEYSNMTETVCSEKNPENFLNFPSGTNGTFLMNIICRPIRTVESALSLNLTDVESDAILSFQNQNFNWTLFNEKIVEIYHYIDSLVHQEDQGNIKVLNDAAEKFKEAWTDRVTARDAWEASVGVLCKLFTVMEFPLFDAKAIDNWSDLYAVAWTSSLLADNIENVVDQIQRQNNSIELKDIFNLMPQTESLLSKLLRNLAPVTLDLVDMTSRIPVHFLSAIDEYKSREPNWPCFNNESIGEALELRTGSRELVREIEKISCDPTPLINEWDEQPILIKVQKIFQRDSSVQMPSFNWTQGYLNFRRLVKKMDSLMNSAEDVELVDAPSVSVYIKNFLPEVKKMVIESLPETEDQSRKIVDFIDHKIDKGVDILHSQVSAKNIWDSEGTPRDLNYFLALGKFFTNVLHDVFTVFSDAFSGDQRNMNLLTLLGFKNKSAIAIAYDHLPHILATFINGMSDPTIDSQAIIAMKKGRVSCAEIFSWFENSLVDLSVVEYRILKNFTCDLDADNFNAFTDLYMKQTTVWEKNFADYQSYFLSLIIDLTDLGKRIQNQTKNGMKIVFPFNEEYFDNIARTLSRELNDDIPEVGGIILRDNPEGRNYRLAVEGISEVISKMAKTLSEVQLKNNELHTWDLFEKGDVHQFVKLLENYPQEAIAFFAVISEIDPETMQPYSIKHFKKNWCTTHPKTGMWMQANATHFLSSICSFDFDQLLKTLTSEELFLVANGHTDVLKRVTPLSKSVSLLLKEIMKLSSQNPKVILKSNIFNATTWRNIPIDGITWRTINRTELSWVNKFAREYFPNDSLMGQMYRVPQVLVSIMELLSGGDIWQKLQIIYKDSKIQPLLTIVEDLPNLVITVVDTFINSERLNDFAELLFAGKVKLCDIDKYLIPPKFIKKKKILTSITDVCQKFVNGAVKLKTEDFLPLDFYAEKAHLYEMKINSGLENLIIYNETYLVEKMYKLQATLIQIASEGFQEVEVPIWWSSFKEETLKQFLTKYRNTDLRKLAHSSMKKSVGVLYNILNSTPHEENCTWCHTLMIEIVNTQLIKHSEYSKLICKMRRMKMTEIQDTLVRDFYWNKTVNMIKDYKYLNNKKTLKNFMGALENSLHYIADILVDYHNVTFSNEVKECFYKLVGGPSFSRPGLYVMAMNGILDTLEKNVQIFNNLIMYSKIKNLTAIAEKYLPIWKPLSEIIENSNAEKINHLLPNAEINVNLLSGDVEGTLCYPTRHCQNSTVLYEILSGKEAKKLILLNSKTSKFIPANEIAELLFKSLNFELIERKISLWRKEAATDLVWIKNILKHVSAVMEEGGNLFDVASKIDFENVSNALGVPDLVDGVVNIVNEKTIDKLFEGINEILDDFEPFIEDPEVTRDLRAMVFTFESMEIFKNLGLLNMKYGANDLFKNWDVLSKYLVENVGIPSEAVNIMSEAKVDMISVFLKQQKAMSLMDTICSPTKLSEMLSFEHTHLSAEDVSSVLCEMDSEQMQNMTITLISNINFQYIFDNLMSANVKNILLNANLTESDGKAILDNLGIVAELVPYFKEKLTSSLSSARESTNKNSSESMSRGQFLGEASKMLCSKPLVQEGGDFYKVIASLEDNIKAADERELRTLPTEFCRETYKNVLSMPGGKIIWSYVKPLLRGRILFTPNTTLIQEVMKISNQSFVEFAKFSSLMNSFQMTLVALKHLAEMGDNLKDLENIMSSDVMKVAVKSMSGSSESNVNMDLSNIDLTEIAWELKNSERLINMIEMLNDLMDCVLLDRYYGFATEEELEKAADELMETHEFLAGVVFLADHRQKRSLEYELPHNVTYKIRMDVDYVQTTTRLKTQFWLPGPEADFLENMRYMRGFIQLQDSIDRAIIRVKSRTNQDWMTLTRQMPYPCWKFAPFQSTLYESQGVIVCFFFALMMCIGASIRHIVWERESQNSMVMSVMGLKPWRNTAAWWITSFIELSIIMCCIALILLAGKILPKSDPLLLLTLFFDYIFSIVAFCYMISIMFSSASLAAVTAVTMFLLTYMPYIVVIAMEAAMGLGYKLLICLSMSTSFSYGCLFAVRKEVQGVGLQWNSMWEESTPGDPMSLGLVLIMIFVDGCIYSLIGYLIARYTNSDEETDSSSLTVNEAQVGVSFEGVRKVYQIEQGSRVAVDDFTLKLCEGEVTSLLGRNGAGKTTIIKMLTGMIAPTAGEIRLNGKEGTKPDIGVCPQDNVLIPTLTPREHMTFYAKLKKPSDNLEMTRNVDSMMASLELGRQEHDPIYRLSGGTKRRLCVALAFLGSPKLVILDEPGAGVDPAARRRIWRLIDQHRVGRTVLLSTHHLDEADMLSDTVVIMHKGKILRAGSPLTLKMTLNQGYKIHISFPVTDESKSINKKFYENVSSLVKSVVTNAFIREESRTEILVVLPFFGLNGVSNDISAALKIIEDNKDLIGFTHFSLECDTLEKFFLDLCSEAENGSSMLRNSQDSIASAPSIELYPMNDDDVDLIGLEPKPKPSAYRQSKALLKKRIWHFTRDWRSPLAALILPTVFVAVAMGFSLIRPPSQDEPPLILKPKLYNAHPTHFYSIDNDYDPFLQHVSMQLQDRFGGDSAGAWQTLPNDTGTCDCLEGQQVCRGVSQAVEGLLQTPPGRPTLDWIVSTHQEYIEKRYGGWSLSHWKDDPLFVVWFNNKGHHALPAYLNALNEAIMRASGVDGYLITINHPLKLSSDQLNRTTLLQHVADVGIAIVLLVAFSLVGAQGAKELVRERLSEEKCILYLAGVHPVTYWTTALIWDLSVFQTAITLALVVFEIFGLPAYVARDNLMGVTLLLSMFAWAVVPFTHLVEKAFDDSSLSNMVLFCVNTFLGVAALTTILVIDILGKSQTAADVRNFLHHVLLLLPQYALGDALVQMTKNDITAELLGRFNMDTYKSPLGWNLIGLHYVCLFVVGTILYLANLAIECRVLPDISWRRNKVSYEDVKEDPDVARERIRVEKELVQDILKIVKLRKEYKSFYGKNIAVQNLSFGVEAGTCFGLLGINGAGKSSTFKMLTTKIKPTAGKIFINGREIGTGPLCNGEVGYCPQSDALDGFLTPHQCLTIHGEVCGLADVSRAVERMLKRFDLIKYAHQRVDSLSGGNKRKLCTAISVMAPVSLVLMDEPTSGMDPASKGLVSHAVRHVTRNQGSVIMTSHSVVECEKLCSRVGILAKAGLRCIGSPQHLKHRFGEGYIVFLRTNHSLSLDDLKEAISKYIPKAIICSRQARTARLLIPRGQDITLSVTFTKVKNLAEDLQATDFTLTQSSLDQVLVSFSEQLEDSSDSAMCFINTCVSSDAIHLDTF
ncbi:ATP-binding cassette sub-family A member 13 isoform X2 [Leptopilina heterotoma]|uniref:ATP-binding cassette sub-family A member 13 isoform X2 n=1 Tax=Leptopilina heterotoma TaxID=63436 RepID=UPI001CA97550|nr:ATP-binding cassette sub-family A member 13 isoform X2 [Leptopilina heterotoma]